VSIEVLRERLGHRSLVTTQKFISTGTIVDTTAALAMHGQTRAPPTPQNTHRRRMIKRTDDHRTDWFACRYLRRS
jgi:hypothetical protein